MNYNVKHMTQISNIFNTHLEISGNDNKDLTIIKHTQISNIFNSHLEISGNDNNELQL